MLYAIGISADPRSDSSIPKIANLPEMQAPEARYANRLHDAQAKCVAPASAITEKSLIGDLTYGTEVDANGVLADMRMKHGRPFTCTELRALRDYLGTRKVSVPYIALDTGSEPTPPDRLDTTVVAVLVPNTQGEGNVIGFVPGNGKWTPGPHFLAVPLEPT